MARLSMNEMTTYRWSFEEDVSQYVAAGIPAIGVWRQKLADYGEEKGVELLAESGLAVSNLLWAGGFTGSDGRTLRDSIDDALDAVRIAADMRAACLVVYSGGRAGHTLNHACRIVRDALKAVADLAGELGVTLALEPMHAGCADEWTFLTSLDAALALVDSLHQPHIKLAFDTYHLGYEADLTERLARIAQHVAVVHLGDSKCPPDREQNRSRLGEGELPLREIAAALIAGGYQGYFDVELIGEEIEASDYQQLLSQSKHAFAQLVSCQTV